MAGQQHTGSWPGTAAEGAQVEATGQAATGQYWQSWNVPLLMARISENAEDYSESATDWL